MKWCGTAPLSSQTNDREDKRAHFHDYAAESGRVPSAEHRQPGNHGQADGQGFAYRREPQVG